MAHISEKVIEYAKVQFEIALRQMFKTESAGHSFRLSDDPPVTIVLMIAPTAQADSVIDAFFGKVTKHS